MTQVFGRITETRCGGTDVTDDIVTTLRNECQCSDDCRASNDPCIPMRAADGIERLRTHMDALVLDNVELMAKVATLQATIDGRFESTSTTQAVRGA